MQMVFSGERRNPMQIKVTSSGKQSFGQQTVYGYEITSGYLAEGRLLYLGGCTANFSPLFCRAGRGKEKPTSRTPQLLTHPPGEGDAAARPMQTLSSLLGLLQRMTIYCPF